MVLQPTDQTIQRCAEGLAEDALFAVPTETVYGLAGNALSTIAVRKIFEVKGRPFIDPLIVHCASARAAVQLMRTPCALVEAVAERFWPGALTLVVEKGASIPDLVTAGRSSMAVRVPSHPVLRRLLHATAFPLAAPSANPFGYVSPTRAAHVEATLGHRIAGILDGGPCAHGIESTILDLREPTHPGILRHGPVELEALADHLKLKVEDRTCGPAASTPQSAPGMLSRHYSPRTPLTLLASAAFWERRAHPQPDDAARAFIAQARPADGALGTNQFWFSECGRAEEVARQLFHLIQTIDQRKFKEILVEQASDRSIGRAINDRLRRAAAKG